MQQEDDAKLLEHGAPQGPKQAPSQPGELKDQSSAGQATTVTNPGNTYGGTNFRDVDGGSDIDIHHGDNYTIIINGWRGWRLSTRKGLQRGRNRGMPENGGPEVPGLEDVPTSDNLESKIEKVLEDSLPGANVTNRPDPELSSQPAQLPQTPEAMEQWYYEDLSEYERCFVQAAAVLHEAPEDEVWAAAYKLYRPIHREVALREAHLQNIAEESGLSLTGEALDQMKPSQLYRRTHISPKEVDEIRRLYWKESLSSELPSFRQRVLSFVAHDAITVGRFRGAASGQSFLDQLKQWPYEFTGESSWRSASALGAIWREQNKEHLLKEAEHWASSVKRRDWQHAAALLDGAYDVERHKTGSGDDTLKESFVLQILDDWTEEAHTLAGVTRGCAAAIAYGLIGRSAPEVALQGLEALLEFPGRFFSADVFTFVVANHLTIAQASYIKEVLAHLATMAGRLVHYRTLLSNAREYVQASRQREVSLGAIFAAFFLIASYSLSAVQESDPASYSLAQPMPKHPAFPDKTGKDVLLAGLLSKGGLIWQKCLAHLLCAAFLSGGREQALDLLWQWGNIVLTIPEPEAEQIENAYVQFMVLVGKLLATWCEDLEHAGIRPLPAYIMYRDGLSCWQSDMRELAQKVLFRLPAELSR